jgi:hypothetical protein
MREEDKKLSDRIHAIEKVHARIMVTAAVAIALIIGVVGYGLRGILTQWISPNPSTNAAPVTSHGPPHNPLDAEYSLSTESWMDFDKNAGPAVRELRVDFVHDGHARAAHWRAAT